MKNYFALVALFFVIPLKGFSQGDWINYSRDYYKIPTAQDGVYQLSYTALSASGINMNRLDPRDIRVYHRGAEVAVHVGGQDDGIFNTGDYLEFVGKRNEGTLDRLLYQDPESMPNPYYNTHNDTTAYFLTVSPGVRGKRMPVRQLSLGPAPVLDAYGSEFMEVYSDQYALGQTYTQGIRLSTYDQGQGWMGTVITRGNEREYIFNNLGQIEVSGRASIEIGLVGRAEGAHLTALRVGPSAGGMRELGQYSFQNFDFYRMEANLAP